MRSQTQNIRLIFQRTTPLKTKPGGIGSAQQTDGRPILIFTLSFLFFHFDIISAIVSNPVAGHQAHAFGEAIKLIQRIVIDDDAATIAFLFGLDVNLGTENGL